MAVIFCGSELSWLDRSGAQWLRTTAAGSVRQWLQLVWWLLQAVLLQRWLRTTAAGPVRCIMRAVPPYHCGNGCELPPLGWCGFYCKLPRLDWCGDVCKQATAAKLVRLWLQAGLVRRCSRLKIKKYVQHDDNRIIIINYEISSYVDTDIWSLPFSYPKMYAFLPFFFRRSSVHLGVRKRVKPKMTRVSVLGTDAIIEILE